MMKGRQSSPSKDSFAAGSHLQLVANSLAKLLEAATREFERDRNAAKASLAAATHIVQAEIERGTGTNVAVRGGLTNWQILRVRTYIDRNLNRTICIRDLSAVVCRSPAHFSRKFKLALGEPPHAFVVRRRLETACHLMVTSKASLGEIASIVGFSDQAHLCRLFKQTFGDSPANWRRERKSPSEAVSGQGIVRKTAAASSKSLSCG